MDDLLTIAFHCCASRLTPAAQAEFAERVISEFAPDMVPRIQRKTARITWPPFTSLSDRV